MAEALHEKKVIRIAEEIEACSEDVKLVLISGSSSSGKTTFSKRLAIQLKVAGLKPHAISLDDYFVNRVDNPKDENGDYDFETIKAIDIELFNSNVLDLMAGKEVQLPKFDFNEGKRVYNNNVLKIGENDILIVEGIHGLNPELTAHIEDRHKFSIFISFFVDSPYCFM
jgi:uridine kinase